MTDRHENSEPRPDAWHGEPRPNKFSTPPPAEWVIPDSIELGEN